MTSETKSLHSSLTSLFDSQGTGYVTLTEIEAILIANGYLDEKADVLAALAELDRSADNEVAIEDIARLIEAKEPTEPGQTRAEMFRRLDKDHDGRISVDDLLSASGEIGFNFISREQAVLMVSLFDYNEDGFLSQAEFENIFN